jgi:mono/diheme cytochrome c family protein
MLKKIVNVVEVLALIAAGVWVVLLLVVEPSHRGTAATAKGSAYLSETGGPASGKEIYAARCSGCHGSNGQGGGGPRLAGRVTDDFPHEKDQIAFVTKGGGGMPAFGSSLSAAHIKLVVEYTRTGLGN